MSSPRGWHLRRSSSMSLSAAFVSSVCALAVMMSGCESQSGYVHESRELTSEDRQAIHIVESSPMGRRSFLRTAVAKAVEGAGAEKGDPIRDCDYTVQKIIERNGPKVDGRYFEHFAVFCVTTVGSAPELRFRWDLQRGGFGVEKFEWGWASTD